MSKDVDAVLRAVYLQVEKAKNLDEAKINVKAVVGPENVAIVNETLYPDKNKKGDK